MQWAWAARARQDVASYLIARLSKSVGATTPSPCKLRSFAATGGLSWTAPDADCCLACKAKFSSKQCSASEFRGRPGFGSPLFGNRLHQVSRVPGPGSRCVPAGGVSLLRLSVVWLHVLTTRGRPLCCEPAPAARCVPYTATIARLRTAELSKPELCTEAIHIKRHTNAATFRQQSLCALHEAMQSADKRDAASVSGVRGRWR